MDRDDVIERIRLVVERVLNRGVPALGPDTRLLNDLGLDSVGILETLIALEDQVGFEVDIDNLDPGVFDTAGSLADYVTSMTAKV
ncbi:MAG TPA: phosphopantetheine-binding protein [Pseudonocardiaceae bacterium]